MDLTRAFKVLASPTSVVNGSLTLTGPAQQVKTLHQCPPLPQSQPHHVPDSAAMLTPQVTEAEK